MKPKWMTREWFRYIDLFVLGTVLFIFIILFAVYGIPAEKEEVERRKNFCAGKTVASIGGCDKYGMCGVTLSSGERHQMQLPAIGQRCN